MSMGISNENLANNLQELIKFKNTKLIRIYQFEPENFLLEDTAWDLSEGQIKIGLHSYDINLLIKYRFVDHILSIYL